VPPNQRTLVNRLLAALPSRDRQKVLAGCESVDLAFGDVLHSPGDHLRHVYFPVRSFISLIMPIDASSSLEVGLIGNEGMFGIPLLLGVDESPMRAVVQGGGPALRMSAARFIRELGSCISWRNWPLRLRSVGPTRADCRLYPISRRGGAAGALAVDDAGSRARRQLQDHAGIHGLHAWRSTRRRHESRQRVARTQADSLPPWRHDSA
jgi:hypothetical protein